MPGIAGMTKSEYDNDRNGSKNASGGKQSIPKVSDRSDKFWGRGSNSRTNFGK